MSEIPRLNRPIRRQTEIPTSPTPAPATASTPVLASMPMPSTITALLGVNPRDLDRNRAAAAWNNIQSVKPESFQAKYGSLARNLPTMIQVNGLAQTLAFLRAKGKNYHNQAFAHLSDWVCDRFNWTGGDLLSKVIAADMDSQRYRLATTEALAFLQWLKRFAEAELVTEEEL